MPRWSIPSFPSLHSLPFPLPSLPSTHALSALFPPLPPRSLPIPLSLPPLLARSKRCLLPFAILFIASFFFFYPSLWPKKRQSLPIEEDFAFFGLPSLPPFFPALSSPSPPSSPSPSPVSSAPLFSSYAALLDSVATCWGHPSVVGYCDFDYAWLPLPKELFGRAERDGRGRRRVVGGVGESWGSGSGSGSGSGGGNEGGAGQAAQGSGSGSGNGTPSPSDSGPGVSGSGKSGDSWGGSESGTGSGIGSATGTGHASVTAPETADPATADYTTTSTDTDTDTDTDILSTSPQPPHPPTTMPASASASAAEASPAVRTSDAGPTQYRSTTTATTTTTDHPRDKRHQHRRSPSPTAPAATTDTAPPTSRLPPRAPTPNRTPHPIVAPAQLPTASLTPPPRPLRIVYFASWGEYIGRHDRFFYHEAYTAALHPHLRVYLWGPGFPGYDENKSVRDNLMRLPGVDEENPVDVVYTMTWGLYEDLPDATVTVHVMGDCFAEPGKGQRQKCVGETETYAPRADVVVSRYAVELWDMFLGREKLEALKIKGTKLWVHQQDCADPGWNYPLPFTAPRNYTVQVFGSTYGVLYPLRAHVSGGIAMRIIQGDIFNHQGYATKIVHNSSLLNLPPGTVDPNDPLLSVMHERYAAYTAALRHTQICVFDSTVIRKAIRKFHEAMLSGCVVASDLPDEMHNEMWRGVVIELDPAWTAERIQQELAWFLERPMLLRAMAVEAFRRARMGMTCAGKVDSLLDMAARARRGDVGYHMPYGFRGVCRRYGAKGSVRSGVCSHMVPGEIKEWEQEERERKEREEEERVRREKEFSKKMKGKTTTRTTTTRTTTATAGVETGT
ncbi:hypothetical protein HDU93_001283 [Gonapodya sp. JEL0774]|nr:hypothetical protein HDU93_001283 [Gonapodya sp. JEL0774]